ncbi:MAG: type II toxin-antitoxin system HigB family toxin [Candidatus Sumerlaeota bacterium]|nr:type II toxin-antitoxin system HigB family toxin [Candidatus Sumerlaeota bacterium]
MAGHRLGTAQTSPEMALTMGSPVSILQTMRIIGQIAAEEFWARRPEARGPLRRWLDLVKAQGWRSPADLRRTFPQADLVKVASGDMATVFNIGGNKFRLVARVDYGRGLMMILRVMTHAEYSRGRWKDEL